MSVLPPVITQRSAANPIIGQQAAGSQVLGHTGTAAAHDLNLTRLREWLRSGALTAEQIAGGLSNSTYRLRSRQDGTDWVLRTPPPGVAANGAHDIVREHRITTALLGTEVPVPRPVALCEDHSVIGTPFRIYEFVPGTSHRTPESLTRLRPGLTRTTVWSLIDTLASLHAVVPAEVGLAGFGRPEGFLERQLDRWSGVFHADPNISSPEFKALHLKLRQTMPASAGASLVHGDYRLDNVLARDGAVVAVLDWEMAAVGDPLTDLGLLIAHALRRDDVLPNPALAQDHPSPAEMIRRYALRTEADMSSIGWYIALGFLKLAAIAYLVHRRYRAGHVRGEGLAGFDRLAASAVLQGNAMLKEW